MAADGPEAILAHPSANKDVGLSELKMPPELHDEDIVSSGGLITTDKTKLDVAAEFLLVNAPKYANYSLKEAARVRWKIDLRIVPMMWLTQTLCALDVSGSMLLDAVKPRTNSLNRKWSFPMPHCTG